MANHRRGGKGFRDRPRRVGWAVPQDVGTYHAHCFLSKTGALASLAEGKTGGSPGSLDGIRCSVQLEFFPDAVDLQYVRATRNARRHAGDEEDSLAQSAQATGEE